MRGSKPLGFDEIIRRHKCQFRHRRVCFGETGIDFDGAVNFSLGGETYGRAFQNGAIAGQSGYAVAFEMGKKLGNTFNYLATQLISTREVFSSTTPIATYRP